MCERFEVSILEKINIGCTADIIGSVRPGAGTEIRVLSCHDLCHLATSFILQDGNQAVV